MVHKFFTRTLAEKIARKLDNPEAVYYLRHGEQGRPDYKVVKFRDGFAIKVVYCFSSGTFFAPKNHFLTKEEVENV